MGKSACFVSFTRWSVTISLLEGVGCIFGRSHPVAAVLVGLSTLHPAALLPGLSCSNMALAAIANNSACSEVKVYAPNVLEALMLWPAGSNDATENPLPPEPPARGESVCLLVPSGGSKESFSNVHTCCG